MVGVVINNNALDDRAGPGSTRGQGAGPPLKSPGSDPMWAGPALQMSGPTTWPDRVRLGQPSGQPGLALPVDSVIPAPDSMVFLTSDIDHQVNEDLSDNFFDHFAPQTYATLLPDLSNALALIS